MPSELKIVPPEMLRVLEESGADWEIERRSKHNYLVVNGDRICVLSRNAHKTKRRTMLNSLQRIKRALK